MQGPIGAVATGAVRGAIGIIRLSGEGCVEAAQAVFSGENGKKLGENPPGKLVYGRLFDKNGAVIDRILAVHWRAPHSFTGEDAAELHCHGSPTLLSMTLEALMAQGVRLAQPGEFTRRAFLNGKLDLTQAEGVADLIDAPSPAAVRAAGGQLAGALSRRVEGIYQSLLDLAAHLHATVDYPEEDLEALGPRELMAGLEGAEKELDALLQSYDRGRLLAGGVPCAIVGRPNVGKSSLLNALLGYDRAIVTPLPGTTRDTVEELCQLGGVALRLTDTAGLRETEDEAERLGVARSRAALEGCELALVVLDGTGPMTPEDAQVLTLAEGAPRALCLVNKADLPQGPEPRGIPFPVLQVSAKTGQGLDALEGAVAALFPTPGEGEAPLTNPRQYGAALAAREALGRAKRALADGLPVDLPLLDVEGALEHLGELTGKRVREELVDRIFSRFCLGK